MFTSTVLALLLTVVSQTDADRAAPPERPVFGFPTEDNIPVSPSSAPKPDHLSESGIILPESFHNDARLTDLCFVDDQYGWAVGDRGTIWHTQDGGREWRLQQSGINCTLQSVCFITRKIGWAAGGSAQPYSHAALGVLLSTRDGGQTWTLNPRLILPALKRIVFSDPEHGWAIGFPTAMYPSGVFSSEDAGRSWSPLAGKAASPWLTGDFLTATTGALAGSYASAATIKHGEIEPVPIDNAALQHLRQLRLVPPSYGWLVGDGGLIMLTVDAGTAWRVPSGNLPIKAAQYFDFSALAVRGPKAWIAGTPGTRVFYTPDAGSSWSSFPTGLSTPLLAITFIDDQHGWAAGALGAILATTDGGQTWQKQRSGGTQAAILALVAQADDVPLELIAKTSGNDGYLSAVEVLTRRDIEVRPNDGVPAWECLNQAVVAVGGSYAQAAWQFPLRQTGVQLAADDFIKGWDSIHNGHGLEALEEHLVGQLRLWRPEAVVTNNVSSPGADQLGQLIGKAVLQAVEKAADPSNYPRQIAEAGLSPWQVKKVYAPAESGAQGSIDITTSQFAPRLGRSLADASANPRGLISDRFSFSPMTLGFSLLADYLPDKRQSRDLTGGLMLPPGGGARRELANVSIDNLEVLQRMALKQRNTQAILEQAGRNPDAEIKLLAQSDELIRGLDDGNAGLILYYLADRYYRTGQWSMAAETFQLLADRYPQHPLTRQALLWLVQYHASGEAAWREQLKPRPEILPSPFGRGAGGEGANINKHEIPLTLTLSQRERELNKREDRFARAVALGKRIERTYPELFAEPALRLPLEAARRNQGSPRPGEQSRPTQRCWHSAAKPKLDGRLDDELWQKIESEPLKSALKDDDQWPAVVAFAYDDEFFYIAIHCRRAPGVKYEPATAARSRDADLTAQDRVDVLLDIDCDFATYYRLSVDYRGFTADSCWNDASWNPTWYVAADLTDETWTVEAAVPLDQLGWRWRDAGGAEKNTGKAPLPPIKSRDRWAIGVQRTIPGVGFQSWSTPASTQISPEGFGYLVFE